MIFGAKLTADRNRKFFQKQETKDRSIRKKGKWQSVVIFSSVHGKMTSRVDRNDLNKTLG